jgi:dihydrofolate reductase
MAAPVVLYAAVSLDGYLAEAEDGLDFLEDVAGAEGGYEAFFGSVSALVMGRRTYDVVRALGAWPYTGKPTVVVTSRPIEDVPPGVVAEAGDDLAALVGRLARRVDGRIWLVGGGALARSFFAADLVDELDLVITPHLLGDGIALWGRGLGRHHLVLTSSASIGADAVRLQYRVSR